MEEMGWGGGEGGDVGWGGVIEVGGTASQNQRLALN